MKVIRLTVGAKRVPIVKNLLNVPISNFP